VTGTTGPGSARPGCPQTQVAGRRARLASPATATALAVVVLLLAAAVIPLSVVAHQSVPANATQLITGLPLGSVAVFLAFAYIPVLFAALPPVFLLFPDGELPSRRWR